MSRASEGWYVAEPDGTTFGPMSRAEMVGQKSRGAYSTEALAWHVDLSEWHPLARVAPPESHGAGGPAHAPQATPQTAARIAAAAAASSGEQRPSKAERKRMAKAAQAQRGGDVVDDGKRLLSHVGEGGDLHAMAAAVMAASAKSHDSTPARAPGHLVPAATTPAGADEAARNAQRFALGARRLLARAIDWFTLGMVGGAALWALIASSGVQTEAFLQPNTFMLLLFGTIALVPIEALALAIAGTTPGKALLGLRVTGPGGGKPSLARAWRRAIAVALRGMAFGVLFFTFFTVIVAFIRLMKNGATSWDANNDLTVTAETIPPGRWQAAAVAAILGFVALNGVFWLDFAAEILAAIRASRGN